jgi:hypothetical protein
MEYLQENASVFECFPYVCPEPVLVKRSFLYKNGFQKGVPTMEYIEPFSLGPGGVLPSPRALPRFCAAPYAHAQQEETVRLCLRHLVPFSQLSLCLSRACLGKMFIFIYSVAFFKVRPEVLANPL